MSSSDKVNLAKFSAALPSFVYVSTHTLTSLGVPPSGRVGVSPYWDWGDAAIKQARRAMIGQLLDGDDRAIVETLLYVAGMSEAVDADGIQAVCRALGIQYPPKPHGSE